ncbi:replication restart helicase PriA [Ideonella paludis]|uniref:Replication restart protein PriA n=1 Tax=Ideonella paludis TaxID=1233411 RepID=A0ABS5DRR9_9BURK|nr:primosomal protein N' [Ideonella paludis]MBQ0933797.1 primosomal protein N' [Ideonella paludis]
MMQRLRVAVETPQYAGLARALDYACPHHLPAGTLVRVPLGQRNIPGIVWAGAPDQEAAEARPLASLKPVAEVMQALPPLPPVWCDLVDFTARYYQRAVGEVALSVLPPELRKLDNAGLDKRLRLLAKRSGWAMPEPEGSLPPRRKSAKVQSSRPGPAEPAPPPPLPTLQPEQAQVLATLADAFEQAQPPCHLLHGVTGSGKTEVYLRAAQHALDLGRQALVLVPEINLTPQLEARFAERFPGRRLVSLHSGLTPAQRLANWLTAHLGHADLVLGTRLAVFCPLPRLGLIVVDEEHDPSYKQQDGARYSARDLAVYRAWLEKVPVVLGSATPSLESWQHAQTGRYKLLTMAQRVGQGELPKVRIVDMNLQPQPAPGQPAAPLSEPLLTAVRARVERGEQSLLFLNRRGFAPVLSCTACGWKSGCPHCSAWRVFHKLDRTLRCHHCSFTERVPKACPDCGNLDIQPVGRGTERLEEQVAELLQGLERPGGGAVRVARIDADTTRLKGALEQQLAAVHDGSVDVLIGTQMVTKGHDFRRVTLVAAVNPDSALFTADFRAPERLFATLMQAAGRAGRDAAAAASSEMWIQTWSPTHPLFTALRQHDFARFAASQLQEREMAALPPFSHLALLRCEARDAAVAEGFLRQARDMAQALLTEQAADGQVTFYAPVPPHVAKVAGLERRQMLIEASTRPGLQRLLAAWMPQLPALRGQHKGLARWAMDVDPLSI